MPAGSRECCNSPIQLKHSLFTDRLYTYFKILVVCVREGSGMFGGGTGLVMRHLRALVLEWA